MFSREINGFIQKTLGDATASVRFLDSQVPQPTSVSKSQHYKGENQLTDINEMILLKSILYLPGTSLPYLNLRNEN